MRLIKCYHPISTDEPMVTKKLAGVSWSHLVLTYYSANGDKLLRCRNHRCASTDAINSRFECINQNSSLVVHFITLWHTDIYMGQLIRLIK